MIHHKPKDLFWRTVILILYLGRGLFLLRCCTLPCLYWLILCFSLRPFVRGKNGVRWSWMLILIFSMLANLICIVFISPAKSLIETLHITRLKIVPLRNYADSLHYKRELQAIKHNCSIYITFSWFAYENVMWGGVKIPT